MTQITGLLGGTAVRAPKAKSGRKKRGMSAAGRTRIAAAQKKRWAAFHASKAGKKGAKAVPVKAKRTISAKHRAAIAAAQKARWAKQKAAK
ncbi:MAG: hypothetical protein IT578_06450 [Verrucomicrobiae bacterium]|nr:hypothetical protein [Verrucomicrobiae bacterium]